jgi:uncharacterized protein YdaT
MKQVWPDRAHLEGVDKDAVGPPAQEAIEISQRIDSGRLRRSSPPIASTSKAQSWTSPVCWPECSALKSEMPSTPSTTASPSITKRFCRFFKAASTIHGKRLVNRTRRA